MNKTLPLLLLLLALPAWAADGLTVESLRQPQSVQRCVRDALLGWNIPSNFVDSGTEPDGSLSVGLNVTGNDGVQVSIAPSNNGSVIKLDGQGFALSPRWSQMVKRCAD